MTDFEKIKNWVSFLTNLIKYSIENENLIHANSIDELPFLTATQKKYYNKRKQQLNN